VYSGAKPHGARTLRIKEVYHVKLPRISVSFPGDREPAKEHLSDPVISTSTLSSELVREQTTQIIDHATAVRGALQTDQAQSVERAAARDHVAAIQLAWQEFQINLAEDRLILRLARRVDLLEQLRDLERRHTAAASELRAQFQSEAQEVQA
jgi:hypothetical protein